MFKNLSAQAGRRRRFWSPRTAAVSVAVHALLLSGAVYASVRAPEEEAKPEEEVTFVEIEEAEPEAPKPAEPPPPPPEAPPQAPPPPKGFQELIPPDVAPAEIPKPDISQPAVTAADFSGVGVAGGRAKGVEGGVPSDAPMDSTPVFTMEETGVKPEITNMREVVRMLERNYPRQYADAGIAGQVQVRFVIDTDGRIDPGSVTVVDATNEAFGKAAAKTVEKFRFRPIVYRGAAVRVWATMPIGFQPPG